MEARLRNLTSISVLCLLFFLFFPLSKWVWLAAFIAIEYVLYFIDEKIKIHVYGMFTVLFILSIALFYPDLVAIVCMCLSSFIFHTIKIEPGMKFIITILIFGIHLLKSPTLQLLVVLIAILLFHLVITIIITSRNKIQLFQRMKVMIALGIGGSVMIGIIPYLASGVRNLLSIGMYGLTSILSGALFWEFNKADVDEKKQERINKLTAANTEREQYQYTEYMTNPYLYLIFIFTLSVIFIVAVIYIVKRRKAMQLDFKDKRLGMSTKASLLVKKDQNKGRVAKLTPPSHTPIRMLVFKFEKDMKDVHKRKHGESFHDWLNRIHVYSDELNEFLSELYEKARYGEEDIPKNKVKLFNEGLKQIKKNLSNQ